MEGVKVKSEYPVFSKRNGGTIGTGIFFLFLSILFFTLNVTHMESIVYIIGGVVCGVITLLAFASSKETFYLISCPYCKTEMGFPVNEKGVNCIACAKRLILKDDGKIYGVE